MGRRSEAGDAIRAKEPENASALHLIGAAEVGKGRTTEGLAILTRAASLAPSAPEIQTALGNALARANRPEDAERAYRAALAQDPKFADALVGLGTLLLSQRKIDSAGKTLAEAKALDPTSPRVRLALSSVRAAEGKLPDAAKELEELPREARTPRVVLALGQLYIANRRFDEAIQTLGPLVNRFPNAAPARYALGQAALGPT